MDLDAGGSGRGRRGRHRSDAGALPALRPFATEPWRRCGGDAKRGGRAGVRRHRWPWCSRPLPSGVEVVRGLSSLAPCSCASRRRRLACRSRTSCASGFTPTKARSGGTSESRVRGASSPRDPTSWAQYSVQSGGRPGDASRPRPGARFRHARAGCRAGDCATDCRGTIAVALQSVVPLDGDGDDVPDAIDDCPSAADSAQAGCPTDAPTAADAATDAAPAVDASVGEAGTDAGTAADAGARADAAAADAGGDGSDCGRAAGATGRSGPSVPNPPSAARGSARTGSAATPPAPIPAKPAAREPAKRSPARRTLPSARPP